MKDPYKDIPAKLKKGQCYKQAIDYLLGHPDKNLRLCHGWVSGRGKLYGVRFSHAWIENVLTGTVIDPSHDKPLTMLKFIYYAIGNIIEERVHKYTRGEMFDFLEKTGKAGPWEKDNDEL